MPPEAIALLVEGIVRNALAPVVARLAAIELKTDMSAGAERAIVEELAAIKSEAAAVRERIAVVEVKAPIPGPAGTDGAPGRDGFDLKAFGVSLDADLRSLVFTFADGEQTKEARIKAPWFMDRGVYKDGTAYEPGDVVTWDGSAWVAREATSSRPGSNGFAWRLCVKRGRDGSR